MTTHTPIKISPHIAQRLQDEQVVWLTSVSADGTPQPNPVWFIWKDGSFVIYTRPYSAKVKNMLRNNRVSINLEGAELLGGDVVIFTGAAEVTFNPALPMPEYQFKYAEAIQAFGFETPGYFDAYSAEIRMTPDKVRVTK